MSKDKRESQTELVLEKLDVIKDIVERIEADDKDFQNLEEESAKQTELLRELKSENVSLAKECSACHETIEILQNELREVKESRDEAYQAIEKLKEMIEEKEDEIRRFKADKKHHEGKYRHLEEKSIKKPVSGFRIKEE